MDLALVQDLRGADGQREGSSHHSHTRVKSYCVDLVLLNGFSTWTRRGGQEAAAWSQAGSFGQAPLQC